MAISLMVECVPHLCEALDSVFGTTNLERLSEYWFVKGKGKPRVRR